MTPTREGGGGAGPAHTYRATVRWTGDLGQGTRSYHGYSRDHLIEFSGKAPILATSGLAPRSSPDRVNPDELLVASLSSCHMLWYLHLCAESGIVVTFYEDSAEAVLQLVEGGGGTFVSATLRPRVRISEGSVEVARKLHEDAHRRCFIANSVRFPVHVEPTCTGPG